MYERKHECLHNNTLCYYGCTVNGCEKLSQHQKAKETYDHRRRRDVCTLEDYS